VVAQIQAFLQVVPLGREDVIASWLPLYHDMGLIACFIIPIATGTPVALQDPVQWARAPQRLFEAIERRRATYAWLPNFAFNHLRLTIPATTRFDLSSLKALINCSEPCKPATVDAFLGRFAGDGVRADMIGAAYAMAEAVFAVTQSPIGRPGVRLLIDRERLHTERRLIPAAPGAEGRHLLSSGRLLPGVSLCVMGEDFTPVDDGQVGQIALRGDYIFHGYHNNPQATQAAFHAGWFLTGDLGAMADGEVFITGRLKDIIIAYGRNFYAHDIEACVAGVADVKPGRVVAFAVDNEIVGSEDVVVVAETTLDPALYRKLSGRIKKAATDALGLSAIRPHPVAPGWIIKTTSGKISRKENLEKFLKERRGAEHGVTA
jgi:acyl-CoA synthetase (AMP-forming)/AMP-acid ligase II